MKISPIFGLNTEQMLLEKLSAFEHPLQTLEQHLNWAIMDPFLDQIIEKIEKQERQGNRSHVGRLLKFNIPIVRRLAERKQRVLRRYAVMMLKVVVLQRFYNLSDENMEYEMIERLCFRRFVGIKSLEDIPCSATIRKFREALTTLGLHDQLFSKINYELLGKGIYLNTGSIVEIRLGNTAVKDAGKKFSFQDSKLAHFLLDGLRGIEIGGSAHNSFHIQHSINVDYCGDEDTIFKKAEIDLCGSAMKVDIVAEGDDLPFKDNTFDYVISSHVIEHYFDPIKAMKEWYRIIKPGGYIFTIAPHIDRVPDEHRTSVTPLDIIIERHRTGTRTEEDDALAGGARGHHAVFNLESFLEICAYLQYSVVATEDPDKKVGNGFTVVVQKEHCDAGVM